MTFTKDELERYSRQIGIKGWGEESQKLLKDSRVFAAGAGGLGSPVLSYLGAAGVGNITICDNDKVSLSNLNRQFLHNTESLGRLKTESAFDTLSRLNPEIKINAVNTTITPENCDDLIRGHDIVMDCLDNFTTRHIVNKSCVRLGIPLFHGGVSGFHGQIAVTIPPATPCLSCFLPGEENEKTVYVCGASAGVIGSMQSIAALKYLTNIDRDSILNRIIFWDGLSMTMESVNVIKNPECSVCKDTVSVAYNNI